MTLFRRVALLSLFISSMTLGAPIKQAAALPLVDFEDLGVPAESYYNGSDLAGGFTSQGATFNNNYNAAWGSWDGFAASTITDNTTPGYGNQYSAITGGGQGGSSTYGVSYPPYGSNITFDGSVVVEGAYFTNTTYSFLSMESGDAYAKAFGGPTGDDPDFFKLAIEGIDEAGNSTGVVDFFFSGLLPPSSPLASSVSTSSESGSPDTSTRRCPPGAHSKSDTPPGSSVTRRASPPVRLSSQTCALDFGPFSPPSPPREAMKARYLPSGLKRGWVSLCFSVCVSCTRVSPSQLTM